jgi:hypothetical protein
MASVAEEESWSDWDETLDEQCQCLLCDQILPSGEECINKHMPAKHGVELLGVLQRRGYQDFYDRVKLVNFIRRSIQQCRQCFHCHVSLDRPEEADHFSRESQCSSSLPSIQEAKEIFLNDARYLLPAIDNDPLLRCLEVVMVETEEDCTEINELTVQTHERLTISASEIK